MERGRKVSEDRRRDGDANEDDRVRHLCATSGGEDLGPGRRLRKQHGRFRLCREAHQAKFAKRLLRRLAMRNGVSQGARR